MDKKVLIIIGGIVIILILLGLWVYLLFFGTPKDPSEVFSNFGFGPDDGPMIGEAVSSDTAQPAIDVQAARLRQLTTRPVAGFTEVRRSTTSPHYLYYGEAGTGHIYSIDLVTGEEKRVSNTTIPGAHDMHISSDASYVVARSGYANSNDVVFGRIAASSGSSSPLSVLPGTIIDYELQGTNELFYLTPATNGSVAKALNLSTLNETELFSLPFSQVSVSWGDTANAAHYVYPRPSYHLNGYLYKLESGTMSRLPISGKGLTAIAAHDHLLVGMHQDEGYAGYIVTNDTTIRDLFIQPLPEKCAGNPLDANTFWCGQMVSVEQPKQYPDRWYQGIDTQSDGLWEITLDNTRSTFRLDLKEESGREIDVTNMTVGNDAGALFFINKLDNALWMYEL